ncbi:AI-2E family transporter [Terribacillus sp. DMT04]|uniref:AI-2E family transporter n=1 Tax=Terribacillus sp. DMT04 TaxID=2850441 RepID=UPI001C2BD1D8|nr:AI-2E family transporter [Terribacillus sp. DMT04]QXE00513.1 AI-2E family transporter [Terribacillus sp. DMT04]
MKNGNATAHHSSHMKEVSRLSRVLLWMVTVVVALLLCFLLIKLYPFYRSFLLFLGGLFLPFIIAGLIAYLLHPVIDRLAAWRLPRWLSILIIYVLFFGFSGFLLYKGVPALINQVKDFSHNLPELTQRYDHYVQYMYQRTAFLPETVHDKMDQVLHNLESRAENFLTKLLRLWNKLPQLIIFLVVTPVIVFYMLKDADKIGSAGLRLLPRKYRSKVKSLVLRIDDNLGRYIRGVLLVSCIVSLLTWTAFTLIRLPYSLVLALVVGSTNIIPYFGPIIGVIPAILVGITISPKTAILAGIAVFIIQLIEGNLLSPYIVGKSIHIHPLLIIFALLVGGELGGIIGMIAAVPVLTIIKACVDTAKDTDV